jgi:hypothetical protein
MHCVSHVLEGRHISPDVLILVAMSVELDMNGADLS